MSTTRTPLSARACFSAWGELHLKLSKEKEEDAGSFLASL
jgi:hypothetical protein